MKKLDKPKRKGFKSIRRDPLDALFSEYIRRRAIQRVGGCERCLHTKHDTTREDGSTRPAYMQLQCSHFWGRGKHSVRYDPDNAVGLCTGCHSYLGAHPIEHIEWFMQYLGAEKMDMLRARAYMTGTDKEAIRIWLKQQLEDLSKSELER